MSEKLEMFLYDDVYRCPVLVVVGGSEAEAEASFEANICPDRVSEQCDEGSNSAGALIVDSSVIGVAIYLKKLDISDYNDLAVLVHEITHYTFHTFDRVGIEYKNRSHLDMYSEVFCYHQEYIFRMIMEEYGKEGARGCVNTKINSCHSMPRWTWRC